MSVLPFDHADRPELDAAERRAMDRPGRVSERLDAILPRHGTVLDVGAGDGSLARQLANDDRSIVALEPSLRRVRPATRHPSVTWVAGEVGSLPLADASVDAAYAAWAYFFPSRLDPRRGLRELHRVVRPGGVLAVVVNAGGDELADLGGGGAGERLDWFTEHGFDVEVVTTSFDLGDEEQTLAEELLARYVGADRRRPEPPPRRLGDRVAVCTTTSRGPDAVRVRGMRAQEAERVGAITLAAYDRYGEITGPYRTFLGDPLHRRDGCTALLVAELDGEVVGTVTYVLPEDAEWEGRKEPEGDCAFRVLAVDPRVEGRGVARALVGACIERAREDGRHRMVITSMAWMGRAHRLYEQLGFDPRPDLAVRFPSGDGVAFTLDLSDEAAERFPPPGPVPSELPWFEDVWEL